MLVFLLVFMLEGLSVRHSAPALATAYALATGYLSLLCGVA